MSVKKLTKSSNQMVAGVLGGIGDYLNIDPTAVRVGFVLLSIISAGFPGLLVYIIMAIFLPNPK